MFGGKSRAHHHHRHHHHHHPSSTMSTSMSSTSRKATTSKRRLVDTDLSSTQPSPSSPSALRSSSLPPPPLPPPPYGPPPAKSARREERTRYTRNSISNNNTNTKEVVVTERTEEHHHHHHQQGKQPNELKNGGFDHQGIGNNDNDHEYDHENDDDNDDDDTSFFLPNHGEDEDDDEEVVETDDANNKNDDNDSDSAEEEEEEGDWSLFYDSQYDLDSDSDSSNSSSSSSSPDDDDEHEEQYGIDNVNANYIEQEDTATIEEDDHDDGVLLDHLESIHRLQRKLDRRKERLRELSARRKFLPATSLIVAQEEAARYVRMNHFLDTLDDNKQRKQNFDDPSSADNRNLPSTVIETIRIREMKIESERSKPSIVQQTAWFSLFELFYTVPGVFGIWLSTVTNSTFYGTLSGLLRLLYRSYLSKVMSKTLYSTLLVAVGLLLLRLNGTVFHHWLEGDNYTISRVVMSNRTRLGSVDAKIRKWITSLSFVNSAFNLFGYYIVYAGMVHFNYNIFPGIFDSIVYPWLYQTLNLAVLQLEEEELHDNMYDYYKYWSSPDIGTSNESSITAWMEITRGVGASTPPLLLLPPPSTCLIPCDWNICSVDEVDAQLTSRLGMTPSCDMMMEQVSSSWPWALSPWSRLQRWILYMLCNDRDSDDQDVGWTLYFISAFLVALTLSYFYGYSLLRSCD